MDTTRIALLLGTGLVLGPAIARAQADADASYSITGNVALVSDYLYRGLTNTWGGPALQGGGDLTMKNGFAAGVWASNTSDKIYAGASVEIDLYASYGTQVNDDWSWRVGVYSYLYPDGNLDAAGLPSRSLNTTEANAALTWKWLTLKYSSALSDYFAIDTESGYRGDSRGTGYLQLDAALPLNPQWSLALHVGHLDVSTQLATPLANGADDPDYTDFGATLKYQFATHWSASLGATYATNKSFYGDTVSFTNPTDTRNIGGTRGFVMLQGTY